MNFRQNIEAVRLKCYNKNMKTCYLIILDSLGIGGAADAAAFGDEGSNTYKAIYPYVKADCLHSLGFDNIDGLDFATPVREPLASYGRIVERSKGKDTTTGHYEIAGLIVRSPHPVYPYGFPADIIEKLCNAWNVRGVLGNKAASGTEIIKELGRKHEKTGFPIVYTSADSVLQVAASVDTFGLDRLYDCCEKARKIMSGKDSVGRIIARPFSKDNDGNYYRTPDRRDYALMPPAKTVLNALSERGIEVVSVGKISDIFCGYGITKAISAHGNKEVGDGILNYKPERDSLVFANFVDFDMLYGHRNDVKGYANCLNAFDRILPDILNKIGGDDMLIITADHGCDPSTPSTDHSRENVPVIVYRNGAEAKDLGTIEGFYYIAELIADFFDVPYRVKEVDAAPEF